MGMILSKVPSLQKVHFSSLPKGRIHKAKRVLRIDDRNVFIELENGQYAVAGATHDALGKYAVMSYGLNFFSKTVLHAMVRFGLISKKDVTEHLKNIAKNSENQHKRTAIKSLKAACKTLGIDVPDHEGIE